MVAMQRLLNREIYKIRYATILLISFLALTCKEKSPESNTKKYPISNIDSILHIYEQYDIALAKKEIDNLLQAQKWSQVELAKIHLAAITLANKKNGTDDDINIAKQQKALAQIDISTFKSSAIDTMLIQKITSNNISYFAENSQFEQIIKIATKASGYYDHQSAAYCNLLLQLGDAYLRIGDNKKSKLSLKESKLIAQRNNYIQPFIDACMSLCNAYLVEENYSFAKAELDMALGTKGIDKIQKDQILLQKANLETDSKSKMGICEELITTADESYIRFYSHCILSDLYQEQQEFLKAIQSSLNAIATPEQETRMIAKRYLAIAESYKAMHKNDSSLFYIDKGLEMVTPTIRKNGKLHVITSKLKTENTIYDLLLAKVDIILEKPNQDSSAINEVITYLLQARKVSELLRREVVFDESKFDMGFDLKLVSDKLLECNYRLYMQYKDKKYAQTAFLIADNDKAVALQDKIEQSVLMQQNSDSNTAKYISLQKELSHLEILLEADTSGSTKDSLEQKYTKVSNQLSYFKHLNDELLPHHETPLTINAAEKYLQQNDAIAISYFIGEQYVYSCYADAQTKTYEFLKLPKSILDSVQQMLQWQQDKKIYAQQTTAYTSLSHYLYQQLCFPNSNKSNRKLIFLTEGILNNLAFDALLTTASDPKSFLVKQTATTSAYSIRSLLTQSRRAANSNNGIYGIAPFTEQALRNLPLLQKSKEELLSISGIKHSKISLHNAATYGNFLEKYKQYKIVHIATHARAEDNPKLEFYDTTIAASALYNLPMNQDLVYLNTCESGLGKNFYAEGNLSLSRAFYSNGVHNIIATLWNLNDGASAKISGLFYKNLASSKNTSDALRLAKITYLENATADQQAPYYWASAQHFGDGKLPNSKKSLKKIAIIISSVLVGLGLVFIFLKKRKQLS